MKKLFVIAALIAMVSSTSFAQVKFGVKAALNIASISGDDFDDADSRTGTAFGAFAQVGINDKLAFQPELLYSMQGAKFSDSGIDGTLKLDYLQVPLLIKYYVTEGLSINAGPQLGFLLSANYELEYDGESEEEDLKDYMNGIDFGLDFGAGYQLENGLGFDLRYNLGLSNILNEDDWGDDAEGKNSVFQIAVSYAF
jgi:hypothetical protein